MQSEVDKALALVESEKRKYRRERIAKAALQGLLACDSSPLDCESCADYARRAVNFADALIDKLDSGEAK